MPSDTQQAVAWALLQTYEDDFGQLHPINEEVPHLLVGKVREYFNANNIAYESFSFGDLKPYL